MINEDAAKGLTAFNAHILQFGYMLDAGDKPTDTLQSVMDAMMELFK